MATYQDFFPYILPEVSGAPTPVVLNAVRNACIKFCEQSLILNRDHDPVTVIANVVDYDLEPPTGYLVAKVTKAWLDNIPLDPLSPDVIADAAVYNRLYSSYEASPSTPRRFLQKDERSVSLWPMPDKKYANGLTMRVALKPTRASTTIEDVIFEDYAEVIASGALSRLMLAADKPYTNEKMAAFHASEFIKGVNVARSRALHGHTRSNLSVKLRKI
jgi:hypothetical protein